MKEERRSWEWSVICTVVRGPDRVKEVVAHTKGNTTRRVDVIRDEAEVPAGRRER